MISTFGNWQPALINLNFNPGSFARRRPLRASEQEKEEAKRGARKGYYVRPSKALEKGGGFYVPGLEGFRLSAAITTIVFLLLALNRLLLPGYIPATSQVVSESIAAATAFALLIRSLLDSSYLSQTFTPNDNDIRASCSMPIYLSANLDANERQRREWQLASVLSLIPSASSVAIFDCRGLLAAAGSAAVAASDTSPAAAATYAQVWGRFAALGGGAVVQIAASAGASDAVAAAADAARGAGLVAEEGESVALVDPEAARVLLVTLPSAARLLAARGAAGEDANLRGWLAPLAALA